MQSERINGKVIVIGGALSSIGEAAVRALVAAGRGSCCARGPFELPLITELGKQNTAMSDSGGLHTI
ncbi:hypothetical protein [Thermophilibacter sp.]